MQNPQTQNASSGYGFVILLLLSFIIWFIPFIPALYLSTISVDQPSTKDPEKRGEVGPGSPHWTPYKSISPYVWRAAVVSEDAQFFEHNGFDFQAISSSINHNLEKKHYARGASTISQQLVKMAFLSREKSLIRKAREAVGTVILEYLFSKEDILTWYLNLVEFGDGVYGIQEAAKTYFRTKPQFLNLVQAAHLILVLPSPIKWSQGLRQNRLTPFGHRRFLRIVHQLFLTGYISRDQRDQALAVGNFGNPIEAALPQKRKRRNP